MHLELSRCASRTNRGSAAAPPNKFAGVGPPCSALGFRAQPGCRSSGSVDLGPKQERLRHAVTQNFFWGCMLKLIRNISTMAMILIGSSSWWSSSRTLYCRSRGRISLDCTSSPRRLVPLIRYRATAFFCLATSPGVLDVCRSSITVGTNVSGGESLLARSLSISTASSQRPECLGLCSLLMTGLKLVEPLVTLSSKSCVPFQVPIAKPAAIAPPKGSSGALQAVHKNAD